MENKKIVISGIAGSIGVHVLAHILTNTDWFVVGLASFRHRGWTDRINEVMKDHPDWNDRYVIHTHDLTAPLSPVLKTKSAMWTTLSTLPLFLMWKPVSKSQESL